MEYDNTNRGVLFANYSKSDDNAPDYSGKLNIEGKEQNLFANVESDTKVNIFTADGMLTGSVEKTDKEGKSEKYPDWKGSASGQHGSYGVAGWKRTSKKGNNFLSLSIEARSAPQPDQAAPAQETDEQLPF
tara:strand:- start:27 stop:419 length:393 start_codon:yes stop_codon:yes gene_type:complete